MKKHRQATQKELISLAGLWDHSHGDGITLISSLLTPQPPSNHMPLTAHRVTFAHLLCTHAPPGYYSWCLEIATSDQVLHQYYWWWNPLAKAKVVTHISRQGVPMNLHLCIYKCSISCTYSSCTLLAAGAVGHMSTITVWFILAHCAECHWWIKKMSCAQQQSQSNDDWQCQQWPGSHPMFTLWVYWRDHAASAWIHT